MKYSYLGNSGLQVSSLALGTMNFGPFTEEKEAFRIMDEALDSGINFFDTANMYGAMSPEGYTGWTEEIIGKWFKQGNNRRERVILSTKLYWPMNDLTYGPNDDPGVSAYKIRRNLEDSLKRLQTDHIDFYLIHSLNRENWKKVKENGVDEFLDSAIKDGRIRYAGFSFHDKLDLFKEIVDYYNWSFCQMQYNYSDENFQAGTRGLKYAAQKGLGITIMEPLRGGKLVNSLPKEAMDTFDRSNFKRTPAEWGLRWVWNHPEVKVVLSGMNSMEQVKENIKTADKARANSLTEKELKLIDKVKDVFNAKIKVNCTGCEYCMPCPSGVNIPGCFSAYNNYSIFHKWQINYKAFAAFF